MSKEKKLQKLFKDHPEIRDKVFEGLDCYTSIKKENIPDFNEIYGDIIKNHLEDNKGDEIEIRQKKKSIFLKKAFLIPVSICIVISIFFITPAGQAFAESVYLTVVQWFDSGVNIHHGNSTEIADIEEPDMTYYKSIEDVRVATNEKIAWNNDHKIIDDISVEYKGAQLRIVTDYLTSSNSKITINQTIIEGATEWDTNINSIDGEAIDITLADGIHFVGYVDSKYCFAIAYYDNTSVQIFSEESDYDSFVAFIKGIQID